MAAQLLRCAAIWNKIILFEKLNLISLKTVVSSKIKKIIAGWDLTKFF